MFESAKLNLSLFRCGLIPEVFVKVEFTYWAKHTDFQPLAKAASFMEDMLAWQLNNQFILDERMLADRTALRSLTNLEFFQLPDILLGQPQILGILNPSIEIEGEMSCRS